jgi:hypothetical protein
MASTELAVFEAAYHGTEINFKGMTLEQCELIVREELYEGFVRAGMAMEAINRGRMYASAGFSSFNEYTRSKRCPCDRSRCFQLINAASLRIKMGRSTNVDQWTEGTIRPYTRIQPQSQGVRLAKKAATRAAKETEDGKVTPKITREVIQAHTGKMPKAKRKRAKALVLANTPGEVIAIAEDQIRDMTEAFEAFIESHWEDADAERPGSVKRLAQALSDLASYLRS